MQLGFVGTGTMGAPMAGCLIEAGYHLTVYDLRPEATAALCARGARPADSPSAVARQSEVVFTSLPGPREVELAALEPSTGILAGFQSECAYIDMTTNAPAVARRLAEACRARGIDMLDAPVSGRPPTMTVMVGGDEPVFARYRPLFAAMAGNVFYVGEAGASRTFDNIPRSVLTRSFSAGGTLDIVAKDLDLACDLARAVGAPAHLGLVAHDVLARAQARGWGPHG